MTELYSPMFEVVVASLGWTLLHFVWQGALVGVLFGLTLAIASNAGARTRYHIGLFYLALLAALPVVTFVWLLPGGETAASAASIAAPIVVGAAPSVVEAATDWRTFVDPYLPWTVLVWSLGVLLMTTRLLLEWRAVRRLTRLDVEPLTAEWRARVARLRERLNVHRAVVVLRSTRVAVPLVVGWLRPVILVPVSAFTGLTPWQLELILMHELAHVRRHDYIVNLVQVVVETLLFYHPVVRWVSRVVREERELCCDDLVVARSNDPLSYARALAELAGAQSMGLQTSVGSDGGKLVARIKRLVLAHEPRRVSTHWSVGAMLAVFGMSISGLLQPGSARNDEADAAAASAANTPVEAAQLAAIAGSGSAIGGDAIMRPVDAGIDAVREFVQSTAPALAQAARETQSESNAAPVATAASDQGMGPGTVESPTPAPSAPASSPANAVTQPAETAPATASGAAPLVGTDAIVAAVESPVASSSTPQAALVPASAPANAGSAVDPDRSAVAEAQRALRPIAGRDPEFPVDARLDGIEGWVKFSYTIGEDGDVHSVQIIDAKPRNVFETAVRRAVRSWRFDPIIVDGRPVEREMTQMIEFSLGAAADSEEICQRTGTRVCRSTGE